MSALADRLRQSMTLASVSQADLARACGVKAPSLNGWLSGKSKFLRGENLLKAAARLGVSPKWLAEGKGPMRLSGAEQAAPYTEPSDSISVEAALPVALEALRKAPASSRVELAQVLGLLVTTGSALYAQRVAELLAGESSAIKADVARATAIVPTVESPRLQPQQLGRSLRMRHRHGGHGSYRDQCQGLHRSLPLRRRLIAPLRIVARKKIGLAIYNIGS